MSYPEHNAERFFKYASASTALKILETSTVRYSSPLLFNDPFDVQSGLQFDFDIQSLPDRIFSRLEKLVTRDAKPVFSNPHDPWAKVVTRMWDMKATHGFPKDRAWNTFLPALEWLRDQTALFQSEFQEHTWKNFLQRLRVFSLSEDRSNLLMWAHYAKDHKGAVFEFLVLPEDDNALCAAQPVIYSKKPPYLITEEQLLESIFEGKLLDTNIFYSQYARVKSDIWEYEKEWRVWYPLPEATEALYEYVPLRQKEIGAIYLGCRMDMHTRK